jgi:hypothetical protein
MWKTKKRLVWQRWADENAGRIHEHLQKQTGIVFVELKRAVRLARQIRSSARLKACGQGCDAVRIPQKTGNGLPARSPAGAGESRANTRSNSQPKTGDLCSQDFLPSDYQERLPWARELIRRAREKGWPGGEGSLPLSSLKLAPKTGAVFAPVGFEGSEEKNRGAPFGIV